MPPPTGPTDGRIRDVALRRGASGSGDRFEEKRGFGDNDNDGGPSRNSSNSSSSSSNSPSNFGCISCVTRDNDARLLYKGAWSLNGSPSFTTHSTTSPGSSVSFTFNGSGIVVFGTVPQSNSTSKPPTAAYLLDVAPPFVTTEPTANSNIPNQPLFAAFRLSSEEHSLTINIQSTGSPFILESFFVFPRVNLTQHVVDALPPTPTSSPNTSTAASKPPAVAKGAQTTVKILAGILGSLVALIIIITTLFVFRRRHQRASQKRIASLSDNPQPMSLSSRGLRGMNFTPALLRRERPDDLITLETIFTTTESILRNNPSSLWSNYTRSEGGRGSVVDHYLPPPQLPTRISTPSNRFSAPPTRFSIPPARSSTPSAHLPTHPARLPTPPPRLPPKT